mmetsp:Transcript_46671/g.154715  ORF Transcript_46671/g.154715 Transcript_46671/m.154715 type:complete len:284 (+) Transcript_46671:674-1525(+)
MKPPPRTSRPPSRPHDSPPCPSPPVAPMRASRRPRRREPRAAPQGSGAAGTRARSPSQRRWPTASRRPRLRRGGARAAAPRRCRSRRAPPASVPPSAASQDSPAPVLRTCRRAMVVIRCPEPPAPARRRHRVRRWPQPPAWRAAPAGRRGSRGTTQLGAARPGLELPEGRAQVRMCPPPPPAPGRTAPLQRESPAPKQPPPVHGCTGGARGRRAPGSPPAAPRQTTPIPLPKLAGRGASQPAQPCHHPLRAGRRQNTRREGPEGLPKQPPRALPTTLPEQRAA